MGPTPSSLLKKSLHALIPTITNTINLPHAFGVFPDQFKASSDHPFLEKPNSDRNDLINYRPIPHLSFLSQLTERFVKSRLTNFFASNNLLNTFQSAYTKFHCTEATILAVRDDIIRTTSSQQLTCQCLLGPSAALNTTD